jgi:type IX secretion system PorP/SprF family membrane protein
MKKLIKLLFLLLVVSFSYAQDMHFTQYYAAPLYLNPAFTGANTCSRGTLTYRNQWPGISKTYKSFLVSGDHFFSKQRLGVGLLVGNDEAGTAQLKRSIIVPSIAYELTLNRSTSIRFGVQPGIGMRSVNYSKFLFGDQIARGDNSASVENMIKSKVYFDANAGALLYNSDYYLGVSLFHLNRPNESLLDDKSRLPIKFSVQGGFSYKLSPERMRDKLKEKNLSMAFHVRGQNKFDQMDIGLYYSQYVFTLGLWYRGIPVLKAYKPGYANNDAIAAIVGYKMDRISIGYSYDFTVSKLFSYTRGAHEITLGYQYCPPKKKIRPSRRVACAKF